ncbi:MAG TPA: glycosyltransferase family 2 protein [Anaerolineae bacterium]|nr:glycosyltransferase family 2 protein [Anaerolineae bacterium]HQH39356.1 glycosyltransferase family 2 protein [Anaerolineae bacterium]
MKISIIIPAYNEVAGIQQCITDLVAEMESLDYQYEIIVVDDGSSDCTAEAIRDESVQILRHSQNRGYGAALKTGLKYATGELIAITDADGTYAASNIPRLLDLLVQGQYDMVVGARTGEDVNIPWVRRPLKWLLTMFASLLVGMRIPDLNSGQRVFCRDAALEFFHLYPNGFSFTSTITLAMLTNDYYVFFQPINYLPRIGRSKIKPIQDTISFFLLVIRIVVYFKPLKVFLPLSLFLFGLALAVLLGSYFWMDRVMDITTVIIAMAAVQIAATGLLADVITKMRSGKP